MKKATSCFCVVPFFNTSLVAFPITAFEQIAGPPAIEETHEEWNDLGSRFYLDAGSVNSVFFVTNGFDYETLIPEDELEPGSEETTIPHETKVAVGTRVGFKPVEQLELGASFAGFFASDIGLDMFLAGGDAALEIAWLTLKGKYIFHYRGVSSPLSARNHGLYGTLMLQFQAGVRRRSLQHVLSGKKQPGLQIGKRASETTFGRLRYQRAGERIDSLRVLQ